MFRTRTNLSLDSVDVHALFNSTDSNYADAVHARLSINQNYSSIEIFHPDNCTSTIAILEKFRLLATERLEKMIVGDHRNVGEYSENKNTNITKIILVLDITGNDITKSISNESVEFYNNLAGLLRIGRSADIHVVLVKNPDFIVPEEIGLLFTHYEAK